MISNNILLKTIFAIKSNFAKGQCATSKVFDGIRIAPFKNNALAAISISADFELNWAFRGHSPKERNSRGFTARQNFGYLLELFRSHRVPITWATVGHLFLESCERHKSGLAHPNMPRPPCNHRWEGDWYVHDPCTNMVKDPLWYAPDLIQKIIDSEISHEIGTHSFSHIDFSLHNSNSHLIQREIEECILAMEPFRIKPKSLVYPFNNMGHSYMRLLSELGITSVRYRDKRVRLSYPERTSDGVYKIFESMNTRTARHYDYLVKAKIFIEEAMKRNAAYHLWFHPSDPICVLRNEFRRIVEYIARKRNEGQVWVTTMNDLAAYCEARETINLKVKCNGKESTVILESKLDKQRFGEPEVTLVIPTEKSPKDIFLNFDKCVKKLNFEKDCLTQNHTELILNVPVTAHSIRLTYS